MAPSSRTGPSASGMRSTAGMLLGALLLLLTGCAQTRIIAPGRKADIFLDGQRIGRGQALVGRIGPPKTARLEAKEGGTVVAEGRMRREFRFWTVLLGFGSYYTGFYWAWFYPEEYYIPGIIETRSPPSSFSFTSPWDQPRQSRWEKPLSSPLKSGPP